MKWSAPIVRNLGLVLTKFAAVIASLVPVSLIWNEYYAIPGELLAAAIVYGIGWMLSRGESNANDTSTAEALASAAVVWLVVSLLSALPFLLIARTIALEPAFVATPPMNRTLRAFLSIDNAVFEAFSGITGTGLTVTRDSSALPATLQWWRSLLQWLGGIGIIVLILVFVRQSDGGVLDQYYEERSPLGQAGDQIPEPTVMVGAFAVFTLLSIVAFRLAGMAAWSAINHGMTGLATGGFAVTGSSIAAYDALAIRLVALPIMLVGAIPLPVYYLLLVGNLDGFAEDLQTRWLAVVAVVGSAVVAASLFIMETYHVTVDHVVVAAFQFVSAITCTGFTVSTNMGPRWPAIAMLSLTIAMIVGGSEGSTASGVKIVRVVSLVEGIRERTAEPFPETETDREIQISGEHVSANYYNASVVLVLWLISLFAGVFLLLVVLPSETSLEHALFEVASAQGNVGLSSGITGPDAPVSAKLILIGNMWLGRLTIIPVLVFLRGTV